MNKNSLALLIALIVFNSSYCLLGDGILMSPEGRTEQNLNPAEQETLKEYKAELAEIKKESSGYLHTNICWGGTGAGVALMTLSWFVDEKHSGKLFGAGATLALGSGGLGIYSITNENLHAKTQTKRKEKILLQMSHLGKH